jgi:hypothetical protein
MTMDSEGFAVIWRNAQRRRGEMLGVWLGQMFDRLRKALAHSFHLWRAGAAFGKAPKI